MNFYEYCGLTENVYLVVLDEALVLLMDRRSESFVCGLSIHTFRCFSEQVGVRGRKAIYQNTKVVVVVIKDFFLKKY